MRLVDHENGQIAVEFSGGEIHRAIQFAQAIRTVRNPWCDGYVTGFAHARPERGAPREMVPFTGQVIDAVQWGYIRTLSIRCRLGSETEHTMAAGGENAVLEPLALRSIRFLCRDIDSHAALAEHLHWDTDGQSFDALEYHPGKGGAAAYLQSIKARISELTAQENSTEHLPAFLRLAACRLGHLPIVGETEFPDVKREIVEFFGRVVAETEDPIVKMFFAEAMYYWYSFLDAHCQSESKKRLLRQLETLIVDADPHVRLAAVVSAARYPDIRDRAWDELVKALVRERYLKQEQRLKQPKRANFFGRYLVDTCIELYHRYQSEIESDTPRLAVALSEIYSGESTSDVVTKFYLSGREKPNGQALQDAVYLTCLVYFDSVQREYRIKQSGGATDVRRVDVLARISLTDGTFQSDGDYDIHHRVALVFECKDLNSKVKAEAYLQISQYAVTDALGVDRVLVVLVAPGGISRSARERMLQASEPTRTWRRRFVLIEKEEVLQLLRGDINLIEFLLPHLKPELR